MAFRHPVGHAVQGNDGIHLRARRDRRDGRAAVAMGQIDEAARDQGLRAVGRFIGQYGGGEGLGTVGRDAEMKPRLAENIDRCGERSGAEQERAAGIDPAVARLIAVQREGAHVTAGRAVVLRRAYRQGRAVGIGRGPEPVPIEPEGARRDALRRPVGFLDPAAWPMSVMGGRRHAVEQIEAEARLVHDPVVDALEPAVPPADRLVDEIDLGSRNAVMRVEMRPGAHQDLARRGEMFGDAEGRVAIEIGPAAEEIDRRLNGRIVLADRAVPPHGIVGLVFQPVGGPQRHGVEPFAPHVAPAVADDDRIGRAQILELHDRAPPEIVGGEHAIAEMDVFEPAIIGAHDRDDRLERRGAQGRDLKRVVGAPRLAHHADRAVAPGLRCHPGDHIAAVLKLLGGIFVAHDAVAVAGTAQIDPQDGIAGGGETGMGRIVAQARKIAPPIRNVFQNGRNRRLGGAFRQPEAPGEPGSIGQIDPDRLPNLDRGILRHAGTPALRSSASRGEWQDRCRPWIARRSGASVRQRS